MVTPSTPNPATRGFNLNPAPLTGARDGDPQEYTRRGLRLQEYTRRGLLLQEYTRRGLLLQQGNPVCPKPCNPGFNLNPAPLIGGGDGGEGCIGGKGARACQEGNPTLSILNPPNITHTRSRPLFEGFATSSRMVTPSTPNHATWGFNLNPAPLTGAIARALREYARRGLLFQ